LRPLALFVLLPIAVACGDAASYAGKREPASPQRVVASPRVVRPAPAVAAIVGNEPSLSSETLPVAPPAALASPLERGPSLHHFFEALARLDEGRAHDDVHIAQFGDSHTAADYETGTLRRALQARFGDGGRGFVSIGRPWKMYVQEGVHLDGMSGWAPERGKIARGKWQGDGLYGLVGVSIASSMHGARAWTDLSARASKIELSYLEQPRGGSMDLLVDGVRTARISTRGTGVGSGFRTFDVSDAPHHVELQAVGDGDVRVFGMSLDRAQLGVQLDAFGVNGARVSGLLQWDEAHMAEQLKHRAPDLVILAFGTNESSDDSPIVVYERQLVDVLGRIARAVPSASCMLLGPPDRATRVDGLWTTVPRLLEVIAAQRRVAEAAGCAYYSELDAMGGPGSIAAWAMEVPPRAMLDRVHLSREGYAELGHAVADDLLHGYATWRADSGLPPAPSSPAPQPTAPPPSAEPVARVVVGQ
jgi:lysophospholipase L1-like esterase